MSLTRNNLAALLLPGLRKLWGDSYQDYPEEFSQIFDVDGSSNRSYEEDHGITSLGLVPTKAEGRGINYDTIFDGYTTRYTHITYGLGFIVTREMIEDDLYRKIRQMPKALARSVRHTVEILAQNVLNNAFVGGTSLGDGKTLIASDHPLKGGGTFTNLISVAADLDITSIEQAIIDINTNWIDDRGLKIKALPKKLIVHPNYDFQAKMILKSAGLPDTANNNINPAQGIIPEGHTCLHWLSDTNAWFIKTDIPNGLTFFWRRKPEFDNDSDFDSENAKFKTTFRMSSGATDPRCIYGSPGAS